VQTFAAPISPPPSESAVNSRTLADRQRRAGLRPIAPEETLANSHELILANLGDD